MTPWPARAVVRPAARSITSEVTAQGAELSCGHIVACRVLPAIGSKWECRRCWAVGRAEGATLAIVGGVDPVVG